jgi:multidrug resistance efflux pump
MKTAFARTYSRLLADRSHHQIWTLTCAFLMMSVWFCWASRAQITLYEVSPRARVELDSATYPVESTLLGRVIQTSLRVGQAVHRGDVLVEIDPVPDQLQLRQQQAAAGGLEAELVRLRMQIGGEEKGRLEEQRSATVSAEEAQNRVREAGATVDYAKAELSRVQRLQHEGLASDRDVEKAAAELDRQRAVVATMESAARRIPQEQLTHERERDVRIARLQGEIASLQTRRNTLSAGMDRASYEIERRVVRAPIDGRIGETEILRTGAVVQPGERLASIVPSGRLIVAAEFRANAAFGRIQVGQTARMRLDGFPWAEFGAVQAKVSQVAAEIRESNVRVEFEIQAASSFRGKLEHGMPGTVDVAVERTTPLALVLRTAGQWLTVHR